MNPSSGGFFFRLPKGPASLFMGAFCALVHF
jgi:hypothetical protein